MTLFLLPCWEKKLKKEIQKPYFHKILHFLALERKKNITICPEKSLIFNAFLQTPYDNVRVVILGQDPYHNKGQADGLAFSVPNNIRIPPSEKNIFKELSTDLLIPEPKTGSLLSWAKQGVFLLNTILTVQEKKPHSHKNIGWEQFTTAVIKTLLEKQTSLVFLLWGRQAQTKLSLLTKSHHKIFTAGHPSPLSVRFFSGCRHFSQTNLFLEKQKQPIINWSIS
jgi:uracil-DNA glycosylase